MNYIIPVLIVLSSLAANASDDENRYGTFACRGNANIQSITVGENSYSINGIPVVNARWQGQNVMLARLANGTYWITGQQFIVNCW